MIVCVCVCVYFQGKGVATEGEGGYVGLHHGDRWPEVARRQDAARFGSCYAGAGRSPADDAIGGYHCLRHDQALLLLQQVALQELAHLHAILLLRLRLPAAWAWPEATRTGCISILHLLAEGMSPRKA